MAHSTVHTLPSGERSLRALLESTTDAIAVHRDGKIVYANPSGLRMFGYERLSDVVGKSVLEFVSPRFREVVAKRIFKTYAGANAPELEESFLDVGGKEVPVEVFAIPIDFEGKRSTLVHVRDIRVRKELENKLHAADRLAHVGFVAAAVMHESPRSARLLARELRAIAEPPRRGAPADAREEVARALRSRARGSRSPPRRRARRRRVLGNAPRHLDVTSTCTRCSTRSRTSSPSSSAAARAS